MNLYATTEELLQRAFYMGSDPVLAPFGERYEKLISSHPDTKKEMALLRVSIAEVWQLVQICAVNESGAKRKQLADRAKADTHILCKFLDA
jgi:hypothetical protein